MIYTTKETESFDAEILRQELVKAIGAEGWYINTSGNSVEFVPPQPTPTELNPVIEQTILTHFQNGPTREANKAILQQIAELEAAVTDRRIREAVLGTDNGWLKALNEQISTLRKGLK